MQEDRVAVPPDLEQWVSEGNYHHLATTVANKMAKDGVEVYYVESTPPYGYFSVRAARRPVCRAAAALLNLHLTNQQQLLRVTAVRSRYAAQIKAAEDELERGLRCEFAVPEEVRGLVIGKGGANIRRVEERTGVERIQVDRETGIVRIRGPSRDRVEAAREMLEYTVDAKPLDQAQVGFLIGENGKRINQLERDTGVIRMEIVRPEESSTPELKVTGLKTAVDAAMVMVETQLEFHEQFRNELEEERRLREELHQLDLDYGDRPAYPQDGRGGGAGGRGGGRGGRRGGGGGRGGGRGGGAGGAPAATGGDRGGRRGAGRQ